MTAISREQYEFLIRPIAGNRVQNLRGNSHLEAWDVRRHLIRVFGFDGFDIETKSLDLVREIETKQGERSRWTVVYRAEIRLTIKVAGRAVAVFEDGAAGDAQNQPSLGDAHDQAMKTALSQGLKRCVVNLGDQFGMSLYNDGSRDAVVIRSLVAPGEDVPPAMPVDEAPVRPEPSTAPEPAPDVPSEPATPPVPNANEVRDWALKPGRTAAELGRSAARLAKEHPAVAAQEVINENGDEEGLAALLERRAREAGGPPGPPVSTDQHKHMHALWREVGYAGDENRQNRLDIIGRIVGRPFDTSKDLTSAEADTVIQALKARRDQMRHQPVGASS